MSRDCRWDEKTRAQEAELKLLKVNSATSERLIRTSIAKQDALKACKDHCLEEFGALEGEWLKTHPKSLPLSIHMKRDGMF